MLKMTKVELEKISDPDKYMFFEQGMRGGVSYINKRYSKANNEYCQDYDKAKPKKLILCLDMNNFYGHAISQYFFNSNGYILDVDLEYLQELHDINNDYPLAS